MTYLGTKLPPLCKTCGQSTLKVFNPNPPHEQRSGCTCSPVTADPSSVPDPVREARELVQMAERVVEHRIGEFDRSAGPVPKAWRDVEMRRAMDTLIVAGVPSLLADRAAVESRVRLERDAELVTQVSGMKKAFAITQHADGTVSTKYTIQRWKTFPQPADVVRHSDVLALFRAPQETAK